MEPPDRTIVERPELRLYYDDFGSGRADHCLVAEAAGHVVGAVWTRLPEYRGQGIGTGLMKEMLSLLKDHGYRQASLAVQKANYAVRMYRSVGFEITDENEEEYIMVCRL